MPIAAVQALGCRVLGDFALADNGFHIRLALGEATVPLKDHTLKTFFFYRAHKSFRDCIAGGRP